MLLPDRCPAYISKEQYQANQTRLNDNRARAECLGGFPVRGRALVERTVGVRALRVSDGRQLRQVIRVCVITVITLWLTLA